MMDPDATVNLKLLRNGNPTDVTVKLGDLPSDKEQAKTEEGSSDKALERSDRGKSRRAIGETVGIARGNHRSGRHGHQPVQPARVGGSAARRRHPGSEPSTGKNVAQFEEAIRKAGNNPLLLVNRQGSTLFLAE